MSPGRILATLVLALGASAQGEPSREREAQDPELAGHARMLRLLADLGERSYREDPNSGLDKLEDLRARRAAIDDGTPNEVLLQLYPALGIQELVHGNSVEAVELLEKAHALALAMPEAKRPRGLTHLTYQHGPKFAC
jgi:hypothetical protein